MHVSTFELDIGRRRLPWVSHCVDTSGMEAENYCSLSGGHLEMQKGDPGGIPHNLTKNNRYIPEKQQLPPQPKREAKNNIGGMKGNCVL